MKVLFVIFWLVLIFLIAQKLLQMDSQETSRLKDSKRPISVLDFFPELRSKIDSIVIVKHNEKVKLEQFKELGRDFLDDGTDRIYLYKNIK